MPGMVFISDVKFRPFIGSSDICVLSTRYALSMVLVVTRGLDSASTDTASVTLPTARADLSDVQLGVDVERDRDLGLLESRLLDTNDISARLNVHGLKTARFIRTGFSRGPSFRHVLDLDRGRGNEAAGSVYNDTADVL